MLLNKTNNALLEKTSTTANEIITPITEIMVFPASLMLKGYEYLRSLQKIDMENQALREENHRLIIANSQNKALEIENKLLSSLLNYRIPPQAEFITAKVVAQEGSTFAHALTVYIGKDKRVAKGQIAISDKGVIGRVEEVGSNYAKIALINNINSKISVLIGKSRTRGMLVGQNEEWPRLILLPLDAEIAVGDKVITSGIGGVFPQGMPIGKVSSVKKDAVMVKPSGNFSKIEYVMIVNYHLPDPASEIYGEDK
ncbi:MAG: rod shape-determining protein MreC [Alphaproteobacteria bacterium]|nr:rod shape-determining protein MreC [Alphaproteobacteria bacterium]